jgi:glucokinase
MKNFGLGIDIGGTKTLIIAVDDEGKIVARELLATALFYEQWFLEVTPLIDRITRTFPITRIGIGVAGQIDHEGTVLHAPNLGWEHVPIGSLFRRQYQLPTTVINDVRAAAWGEWKLGAGRGYDDLAVLMLGTGIGGALIAGGKLLTGAGGTAGELGHMIVGGNGPTCSCGNEGCLEAQSSGWAIAKRDEAENAVEVISRYHAGEKKAVEIIDDAYQGLLRGCLTIVHAFNPKAILLGGGLLKAFPDLPLWLEEQIQEKALKAASKGLEIKKMALGDDVVALGACHYAKN